MQYISNIYLLLQIYVNTFKYPSSISSRILYHTTYIGKYMIFQSSFRLLQLCLSIPSRASLSQNTNVSLSGFFLAHISKSLPSIILCLFNDLESTGSRALTKNRQYFLFKTKKKLPVHGPSVACLKKA